MSSAPAFNGLLAVDKPQGWTSHDVVARVRGIAGQRQVGHGGTLDPMATGVLPLGLGQGTRLLEYVAGGRKSYEATVRFGAATDTFDAEGAIVREAAWEHLTERDIRRLLTAFTGTILQRPPAYSAIKRGGEPLYRLARRGEQIEIEPRPVTIYRIDVRSVALPDVEIAVDCGSGTYIRSLAHDLGEAAGSAAHLSALRRTAVGDLSQREAVPLDLLSAGGRDVLAGSMLALDRPVWSLPAVILSEARGLDVCQGRTLDGESHGHKLCRAYGENGVFLALLRYDASGSYWQPHKVFTSYSGRSA